MNTKSIIVLFIICVLAAFALGYLTKPDRIVKVNDTKTVTEIKAVPSVPIIIEGKGKIIYRDFIVRDTIKDTIRTIETKPFIASLDTVSKKDTISIQYKFPENYFMLNIHRRPDSIVVITNTKTETIINKSPWYEVPAYILGGVFTGYLIGRAK